MNVEGAAEGQGAMEVAISADASLDFIPDLTSEQKAQQRERMLRAAAVYGKLRKLADDATVFYLGELLDTEGWVTSLHYLKWAKMLVRVVALETIPVEQTKVGPGYALGLEMTHWSFDDMSPDVQIQFEILGGMLGVDCGDKNPDGHQHNASPYWYLRCPTSLQLSECIRL